MQHNSLHPMVVVLATMIITAITLLACTSSSSRSGGRSTTMRKMRVVEMSYTPSKSLYEDIDGRIELHRLDTMFHVGDTIFADGNTYRIVP